MRVTSRRVESPACVRSRRRRLLPAQAPVGVLFKITRELRFALHAVRQQIERAKKHPAWRFQEKQGRPGALETRRRRALEKELKQSSNVLSDATAQFDDLARQAARTRNPKAPRPRNKAASSLVQMDFFEATERPNQPSLDVSQPWAVSR